MAEPDAPSGGDDSFGFLTRKIGPLPVWMWAALIVGAYYWYMHYGPGASSSQQAQVSQVEQDQITVQPNISGSQFKTNAEWEGAALNYLVGESVPPNEASTALYNYLHSKNLSAQQQKDVNLAIEGIGPPPKIPAPATVTPAPKPKPGPKPKPKPKPKSKDTGPEKLTSAQQSLVRRAGLGSEISKGSVSEKNYNKDFKESGTPRAFIIKQSERRTRPARRKR